MRHSFVAAGLLAAVMLLAACSSVLRSKFPTEEEVRAKLQKGMTAEQVLATFGEPPGHQWVDVKLGGKVHYIAPVAARARPGEGYAGFTVYFDRGKVWDWEVILMNPSYEHRLLATRKNKWVLAIVVLTAAGLAGFAAVRYARAGRDLQGELLRAYTARDFGTEELPPDFSFITQQTTLQTVLDQAGPYSRLRKFASSETGGIQASALEYEVPSGGAVYVMPENPSDAASRIRAVLYRRPPGGQQI